MMRSLKCRSCAGYAEKTLVALRVVFRCACGAEISGFRCPVCQGTGFEGMDPCRCETGLVDLVYESPRAAVKPAARFVFGRKGGG